MRVVVGVFSIILSAEKFYAILSVKNGPRSVVSTAWSKLGDDYNKDALSKRLVKGWAVCVLRFGFQHEYMQQI